MSLKVKLNEREFVISLVENYGGDPSNPLDMEGHIIGFDGSATDGLFLEVKWANGFTNWYAPKDLESM